MSELGATRPELSVVLITPKDYSTLAPTMARLRAQTVREKIEVLILAPDVAAVEVDERDRAALHSVRVVEYRGKLVTGARAEGVRQARAAVVAMAEDHCYPGPKWAETILRRQAEGYAVVGPEMVNANPDTAVSWVSFLLAYGPWAQPAQAGERTALAGHNCGYRRELLLPYGQELDYLIGAEYLIHQELAAQGHKLYLDPQAQCVHINLSRFWPFAQAVLHHSRLFAAMRARRWGVGRRLLYTLASPLIPLVRMRRIVSANLPVVRGKVSLARFVPVLVAGVLVGGLGEMWGYATGMGRSAEHDWEHELDRSRFVVEAEREVFASEPASTEPVA